MSLSTSEKTAKNAKTKRPMLYDDWKLARTLAGQPANGTIYYMFVVQWCTQFHEVLSNQDMKENLLEALVIADISEIRFQIEQAKADAKREKKAEKKSRLILPGEETEGEKAILDQKS